MMMMTMMMMMMMIRCCLGSSLASQPSPSSHQHRSYSVHTSTGCLNNCAGAVQGVSIITVQVFPSLVAGLGQHGTYWLFAAVAASSNVFFYCCVPETKGKLYTVIETPCIKYSHCIL